MENGIGEMQALVSGSNIDPFGMTLLLAIIAGTVLAGMIAATSMGTPLGKMNARSGVQTHKGPTRGYPILQNE